MATVPTVASIDKALGRYYAKLGRTDYFDDNQEGKFLRYFEENGFELDDIGDDIGPDGKAEDSSFVDVDDNFPLPTHITHLHLSDDNKIIEIHRVLQKCYNNPLTAYSSPSSTLKVNSNFFQLNSSDIDKYTAVYKSQCPVIFNTGMQNDEALVRVLAIGCKNRQPYLQYICDMYSRDRIKNKHNPIDLTPANWALTHPHLKELKSIHVPNLKKPKQPYDIAQAAIKSFFHRVNPQLMFKPQLEIQDSLEQTVEYIAGAIRFVNGLTKSNTSGLAKASCPFHVDVSIAFDNVKDLSKTVIPVFSTTDDDSDDDDSGDGDDDDKTDGSYHDVIGNVKDKLIAEKLAHTISTVNDDNKDDNNNNNNVATSGRKTRIFGLQFNKFKNSVIRAKYGTGNINPSLFDDYPKRKRFCAFIDRRHCDGKNGKLNDNIDEMLFYEPPNDCNTFPDDKDYGYVPEWHFNASSACIIPNIGYDNGNGPDPVKDPNFSKLPLIDQERKKNITSTSPAKGALLTLSFHVDAVDEIKCYLFINGQMTRFFPEDIIDILPDFFVKSSDNCEYAQGNAIKKLVQSIKIPDVKYQAFAACYK